MAKKRFGIDSATNQALSQTMQMAKEHTTNLNNTVIPVNKIVTDPENPRQHKIQREDLKNGPANQDPAYKVKMEEYEGLLQLSSSIQKEGLLHPVTVYKEEDFYNLIAGERRLYANIIAGKTQIEARVYKNKPKDFDLKIIQWMENDSRKDLTLYKRLCNIQSVLVAYQKELGDRKITAQSLASLLGISRQLAQYYIAIISNEALVEAIKEGRVTKLRMARELVKFKTRDDLLKSIKLFSEGRSFSSETKSKVQTKKKARGRKRQNIALGNTKQPAVAQTLAEGVLSAEKYMHYATQFAEVNWENLDQATQAFQKLVKIIEQELGVKK